MFVLLAAADGSPSTSAITVLQEARDGTVWAGTMKGLYRIDFASGTPLLQAVGMALPRDVAGLSLIRFRGHLPKGGYDVQNGIKTDTAGTTTVH
jgi:hypothetical protein